MKKLLFIAGVTAVGAAVTYAIHNMDQFRAVAQRAYEMGIDTMERACDAVADHAEKLMNPEKFGCDCGCECPADD